MKPLQLANQYMEIFYGKGSLDSLDVLLADNFSFKGPFYQFDSKASYIDALKSDPPENCTYQLVRSFENDSSACLVYQFNKPGISSLMTQLFETDNGRISKIVLVFDSAEFSQSRF